MDEAIKPIEEKLKTASNSSEFKQILATTIYNELLNKKDFAKRTLDHVDDIFNL